MAFGERVLRGLRLLRAPRARRALRAGGVVAGAALVLGGALWLAGDVVRGPSLDSAAPRGASAGQSAGASRHAAAELAEHVTGVETEWAAGDPVRTVISTDLDDDARGRRIAAGIKTAHLQELLADCVEKLPAVVVTGRNGDVIESGDDVLSLVRRRGDCPTAHRSS